MEEEEPEGWTGEKRSIQRRLSLFLDQSVGFHTISRFSNKITPHYRLYQHQDQGRRRICPLLSFISAEEGYYVYIITYIYWVSLNTSESLH